MGLAVLIPELRLVATRPWLKRDDYLQVVQAREVIVLARQEAARIVAEAAREARALKDAAREEAREAGRADVSREIASAAMRATRVMLQLRSVIAGLVARTFRGVLDDMPAEKVYALALRRASRIVREESFITLRVPPGREAAANAALEQLLAELGWEGKVSLHADPALPDHACVLESAAGQVSCGMDIQLEAIAAAVQREVGRLVVDEAGEDEAGR